MLADDGHPFGRRAEALLPAQDEAERRYQRYLAGEMETLSAAEAFAEIRAELSR